MIKQTRICRCGGKFFTSETGRQIFGTPDCHRTVINKNKRLNRANLSTDTIYEFEYISFLHDEFDKRSPDNVIFSVALKYKDEDPIMLTSDNAMVSNSNQIFSASPQSHSKAF